jgi:hypothetical protein
MLSAALLPVRTTFSIILSIKDIFVTLLKWHPEYTTISIIAFCYEHYSVNCGFLVLLCSEMCFLCSEMSILLLCWLSLCWLSLCWLLHHHILQITNKVKIVIGVKSFCRLDISPTLLFCQSRTNSVHDMYCSFMIFPNLMKFTTVQVYFMAINFGILNLFTKTFFKFEKYPKK